MTNNSLFNSSRWINLKYIDMLILQITLDLITDNIINLMEKKIKFLSDINYKRIWIYQTICQLIDQDQYQYHVNHLKM